MKQRIRNILFLSAKALVSSGLIYLVLLKLGDKERSGARVVLDALKGVSLSSVALAIGIFVFLVFLTSIRWGLLLNRGLGIMELFRLQMLGTFFNIFLPGMVGGDAVKAYYLYKVAGIGTEAVASIFMDRYLGYAALMTLGLISYPFGLANFSDTWIAWGLPAMVLAFILGSLAFFGLELGRERFQSLSRVYGYFRSYRARRKMLLKGLLIGLMVHSLNALIVYVLSQSMGEHIPLLTLLVFIPIINTVAALPVSVGGIGLREWSMILLLGTVGVKADNATALSLLWYFSMVLAGSLGVTEYIRDKDYIKDAFSADGQDAG